jgi:hypothetical protein
MLKLKSIIGVSSLLIFEYSRVLLFECWHVGKFHVQYHVQYSAGTARPSLPHGAVLVPLHRWS